MSTRIRLSRGGRKGQPFYRMMVCDSRSKRDGKFIEKVGTYNPLLSNEDSKKIIINQERVKYWLSVGAIPSDKVARILSDSGIKEADKYKPKFTPKKKGDGAKKKALAAMEAKK